MSEAEQLYRPGLEGIIAGEQAISTVEQDDLTYRGYTISDLAEQASFEEVAYLLLCGELPTTSQLEAFKESLNRHGILPQPVLQLIQTIPNEVPLMDVLRSAVSMLGHFDPVEGDDEAAWRERATHVLAATPSIIGARMRQMQGGTPLTPKPGLSHAAQVLYLSTGMEPGDLETHVMNLTLILYAEHDFNASAFAARVTTSTLSDLYSAMVTGIGTLKGPLHGGANEEAMKLIDQFDDAEAAQKWTNEAIESKTKIMGFGHRVYKHGDHRAAILEGWMRKLATAKKAEWRVAVYDAIKQTVWDRKEIHPNVDFPCGLTYYLMDLPIDMYTPLFVASRVSGWAAHVIEQHFNNRLIRPLSRYTGPGKREYAPVDKR